MMRQRAGGYPTPSHNYYGGYSGGGTTSQGGGGYSQNGGGGAAYGGYNAHSQQSYGGYTGQSSSMYGGSAMSSDDDNKHSKRRNSSFSSRFGSGFMSPVMLLCMTLGLMALIMLLMWTNVRGKYNTILKELELPNSKAVIDMYKSLQTDVAAANKKRDSTGRDMERDYARRQKEMERENRLLQKERDELRVKYEGPDKKEEESRLLLREQAFQKQVALLQEATRKESRRTVLENFGPGPHEVQFTIKISGELKDFVIEMAPLDDVPHAVHVFMEQVAHGLWNGCYFYLNGPHVIQAGPQLEDDDEAETPNDGEDDARYKAFESKGLDSLAFPDYSPNFPHLPWTLGFTGRPGGPDFYINKVDNTESHGPGGQYQHALEEQGDACFAKIVRGKENAAALFTSDIYGDRSDWHYFLKEPVEIVKAEILTTNSNNQGGFNAAASATQQEAHESDADAKIDNAKDKLKRKPRLPKIDHAVEP